MLNGIMPVTNVGSAYNSMITVKIDRESISRNPNANKTLSRVAGYWEAHFVAEGKLPDHFDFENDVIITTQYFDGVRTEGIISRPDTADEMSLLPGVTVKQKRHWETIFHQPLPKYLYSYIYPNLICEVCKSEVPVNKIDHENFDDDEYFYTYTVCPNCKAHDSFEPYEFENINTVMENEKPSI